MRDTFIKHLSGRVDPEFCLDPSFLRDPAGCTAVAALVTSDNRVFVVSTPTRSSVLILNIQQANAGDSRSVISSKGVSKALSNDHKPQNDSACTSCL